MPQRWSVHVMGEGEDISTPTGLRSLLQFSAESEV